MVDYITKEEARIVEENHYKKYKKDNFPTLEFIRYFINKKYELNSIRDFICKLTNFGMTKDLLQFKNHLQLVIKDDIKRKESIPEKVYLVYFALKNFIRSERLELLYKMRDNGVFGCEGNTHVGEYGIRF